MKQVKPAAKRLRRSQPGAQFAGQRRRPRRILLATTALQAVAVIVLAFPALAQPAPTARPQGGAIVAGAAAISQTVAKTTVAQSSDRAAIDWRSFDVGSAHAVVYQQPGANSITLNRVTGPDPSQIAGKIQANGKIVIVNGSGVVFSAGSQVDVQSLVVSSANVSNANFMAGKMVFDQPGKPGATISNAGSITVAATGLAALVAPQVANSGVITAKLGHVVLAGAEAHTIDLYGDGLMSVDVTREVRHAPGGGLSLVTNTGMVAADGGTIVLTAKAADGIIQNLVSAGGKLRANTVGDKAGMIVVSAVGGSISIEGGIHAEGRAPGTMGGTVALNATDRVTVGAGARVIASGQAGGGTIAVGTTVARTLRRGTAAGATIPGGTSRVVTVAAGAKISADAKTAGRGGTVALLSTERTAMAGAISARGGAASGDGGRVEVSSAKSLGISGTVDTSAPHGAAGTLLLDPDTLVVTDAGGTIDDPASPTPDNTAVTGAQTITSATFNTLAQNNNLTLSAATSINLGGGTALGDTVGATGVHSISLSSPSITITQSVTATGQLTLTGTGAGSTVSIGAALSGSGVQASAALVSLLAGVSVTATGGAAGVVALQADTLSLGAGATVSAVGGTVAVAPFTQGTAITVGAAGGLSLLQADLDILAPAAGPATLNLGSIAAVPSAANATAGSIALAGPATVNATTLGLYASTAGGTTGAVTQAGSLAVNTLAGGTGGAVTLTDPGNAVANLGGFTAAGNFTFTQAGTLNIAGAVNVGGNTLTLNAANLTETGGTITAGTLTGTTTSTAAANTLDAAGNAIGNIGAFVAASDTTIASTGTLNVAGVVTVGANRLTLNAGNPGNAGNLTETGGTITAGTLAGATTSTTLANTLDSAGNAIGNVGAFTAAFDTTITSSGTLNIAGGVNVGANRLTLNAGNLTETGGTITAGTLAGATTGAAANTLDAAGNGIGNIGAFTAASDTTFTGLNTLNISGAVNVGGNTLRLNAGNPGNAGNLTETGGTITAGTLIAATTSTAAANTLDAAGNAIGSLGGFAAASDTTVTSGGTLNVSGTVNVGAKTLSLNAGNLTETGAGAITAGTFAGATSSTALANTLAAAANAITNLGGFTAASDTTIASAGTLNVSGAVNTGGKTLTLNAGNLTETGGTITAGTLAGTTTSTTLANTVDAAGNAIGNLGAFLATSDTTVVGTGTLNVSGAVNVGAKTLTLKAGNPGAAGNLTEVGGSITAGTLAGVTTSTVSANTLDAAGNVIANLGAFTAASDTTIANTGTLTITGAVNAAGQTLRLNAGNLVQMGGTLTAATLTGTTASTTLANTLTGPGNVVVSLGPFTAASDTSFSQAGALNIAGAVGLGARTLTLNTGSVTQSSGSSITAGALMGASTGGVALNTAAGDAHNAVASLGPYTAATGFTLDNTGAPLTVSGAVSTTSGAVVLLGGTGAGGSVTINAGLTGDGVRVSATTVTVAAQVNGRAGGLVTLGADALTLAGGTVLAAGGTVAVAPVTPGSAMSVDTVKQTGHLSLTAADLAILAPSGVNAPATLNLGSLAALPTAANAAAGSVTLNAPSAVVNATTLGLYAAGDVSQAATAGLTVNTLAGAAGGGFTVDAHAGSGAFFNQVYRNLITNLGPVSATQIGVASNSNLTTTAAISGPGAVTLTSVGVLALNSPVTTSGTLTLQATSGLTQTGVITAGTLSGTVGDGTAATTGRNATLTNAGNQVGTLGSFSTAQGNLLFTDGQAFAVGPAATVTGRNVTLATTGALAMTVNGAVGACAIDAATAGTVTLNAGGLLTLAGTVGGERATVLNGGGGNVVTGGFVEAGRTGTTSFNGTITSSHGLTVQGGTVAANAITADGITQSGGVVAANALNPGSYAFNGGQVYAGNALAVAAGGTVAGDVISAPTVTVNATGGAASTFSSAGDILAGGDVRVVLPGSFVQTAGRIGAGGVVTIAGSADGLTAAPGTLVQSGGLLAGGTRVELFGAGSGPVSITGTVAGPSVQVLQPGADLSFAPGSLGSVASLAFSPTTLVGAAVATGQGYTAQFHCPGCDGATPAGQAQTATLATSGTNGTVRLDGATLSLDAAFTAGTLELHSVLGSAQTAPFTVARLQGTAGYAESTPAGSLPTWTVPASAGGSVVLTAANSVAALGPYYVGGDLALTSAGALTVVDRVVAGANRTIMLTAPAITVEGTTASGSLRFGTVTAGAFSTNLRPVAAGAGTFALPTTAATGSASARINLQTDTLTLHGTNSATEGAVVDARGGIIAIAPLTARALSVDAVRNAAGTLLSLPVGELLLVNTLGTAADVGVGGPRLLQLGSLDGTATNATATSIGFSGALALNNQAGTLGLYATGSITESGGGVSIGRPAAGALAAVTGTITGATGATGVVTLGTIADVTPTNHFDVLGPFTAGAGLSVSDTPDANAGRSGLALVGAINPGTGDLSVLSVGQVLAGVRLGGTIAIGQGGTPATLSAAGLTVSLVARDGAASAAAMTETAGSAIQAATLTGGASTVDTGIGYDVLLNASATNQIGTLGRFVVGTPIAATTGYTAQGAFRLTDASALTVNGLVTAKSVAITANAMTVSGDIGACAVGAGTGDTVLTATAGGINVVSGTIGGQASVTLAAPGGVTVTGATVNSPAVTIGTGLTLNAGGAVFGAGVTVTGGVTMNAGLLHASVLTAGTIAYTTGDLFAGNDLVVAAGAVLTGQVASGGNLSISGVSSSTGSAFAGGTLNVSAAGDFTQTSGTLAAAGNTTVTAGGVVQQAAGALLESGATLLVSGVGTTASTLAGTLSGATVQIVEPNAPVIATPAVLRGAATVTTGLVNSFNCPGCLPAGAGTSTVTATATLGSFRPATLRLDGTTLSLGALAADAVELHSLGATVQTGSLVANTLTGTAGYLGVITGPGTLPVYTPGAAQVRLAPGDAGYTAPGYAVAGAVSGATVVLDQAGNNIGQVAGYQVRGDDASRAGLVLVDAPGAQVNAAGASVTLTGLTLTGVVRAGPAMDPLDASTAALSGNAVTVTTSGTLALNGTLAGSVVTLKGASAVSETGLVVAGTLTTGAGTSVGGAALTTGNQVGTLGAFTASTGDVALTNSRNLLVAGPVAATAGNVTITVQDGSGTAAAKEPGVASTGDLTIAVPAGTTITARNVTLSAVDIVANGTVGACSIFDATTGNLVLKTGGTITVNAGAVLGAQTSVTLTAIGGVSVVGGLVNGPAVTIGNGLTLSSGSVFGSTVTLNGASTMSGGLLHANTLNTPGGLTFTGGDLFSGSNLAVISSALSGVVASGGNIAVTGASSSTGTFFAGGTLSIAAPGDFTQTSGTLAAAGNTTVTAGGVVQQAAGALLESGATLLIGGSGATTSIFAGTLSGATVQIIEPNAPVIVTPLALLGATTVTVGLLNSYNCPGCLPAGTGTSTVTNTATLGSFRPAVLRLDGATLSLGALAADAVELHSLGSTVQTGSLVANTLTGTAGYLGVITGPGTLPVYTPGAAQVRLAPGDAGYTAPGYAVAGAVSGATVVLDQAGNNIGQVSGYQVRGDDASRAGLVLVDAPGAQVNAAGASLTPLGLTLTGVVRAGPATDPLDASTAALSGNGVTIKTSGTLAVNGTLAGNVVTLSGASAVSETGLVVAGTLTTGAGTSVGGAALTTGNQVATLGEFTASTGDVGFTNSRNLLVTGSVAATAGNVTITTQDGTGTAAAKEPGGASTGDLTIAVAAGTTITARNVTLSAVDIVANGTVGACSISEATTGNLVLKTGGTITVNAGAVLGAQTSVSFTALGGVRVQGGLVNGPVVTIGNGLALSGGSVFGDTVTLNGAALMTGGLLHATTLNTPGGLTFTGGDLFAGNNAAGLAITAGPALVGQIVTNGALAVTGADISSGATLFAVGSTTIMASGSFRQTGGSIASGSDLSVNAGGVVNQDAAGTLESAGTLLLRGSGMGEAKILGGLAGATIQVIEPAAALTVSPAAFVAGDTRPLRGAATVTVGPLLNSYNCPGCLPAGTGTSTVTVSATPGPLRPATLRLDGGSLVLGSAMAPVISADTVELHSARATSQNGGSLEALVLTGTAGYAGIGAALPVYTIPAAQTRTASGYAAAGTVAGATVSLDAAGNNIAQLAGYQVRGDDATRSGLTLVDSPASQVTSTGMTQAANGFLVTGTVRAGPSSDPLDGSAAASTGNNVSLTVNGPGQALTIGNAADPATLIGGNQVSLVAGGAITEGTAGETLIGRIVAGTLTGSAGGSVTLDTATAGAAGQGGNQVATLGGFTTPGAFLLQDSRSLTVGGSVVAGTGLTLRAQSGTGTASVVEGQSAGNLVLNGALSATSGDASLTAYGALSGSGVSAASATVRLFAGQSVSVGGVTAGTLTGIAGTSFTASGSFANATGITTVGGALSLTDSVSVTLAGVSRSAGDATIAAPAITTSGSLYSNATIRLHVTDLAAGTFAQTGGTVAGSTLIVSGATDKTPVTGTLVQQAGTLAASASLVLLAQGDATQLAGGTIAAPVATVVSVTGANTFGIGQSAVVALTPAAVDLTGVLPSFSIPEPGGTVALSGRPTSVRLDGGAVTISRLIAADTLELRAARGLLEVDGGVVQAGLLRGSAGYAAGGTDPATGLPTYATAAAGTGSATLQSAANSILRLGNFQAASGFGLIDTPADQTTSKGVMASATGLTIGDPAQALTTVRSGLGTDAAGAAATGQALSISLLGPRATLSIGDATAPATLFGGTVTLTTPGAITEAAKGTVVAGSLASNSGTATTLSGSTSTGTTLGVITGTDLSLATGSATTAGGAATLSVAGQLTQAAGAALSGVSVTSMSTGPTTLSGTVTASGPVAIMAANGTLSGQVQAGTTIDLVSQAGMQFTGASATNAGGAITLTAGQLTAAASSAITAASLSGNVAGTAALGGSIATSGPRSAGGIVLKANGLGVTGTVTTAADLVSLDGGAAGLIQGGTIKAGGVGAVVLKAGTDLALATGSATAAGGAVTLTAGGQITQAAPGPITGDTLASTSGGATSLGGTITTAGLASVTGGGVSLTGALTSRNGAVALDAQGGALLQSGQLQAATAISATSGQTTTLSGSTKAGTTLTLTSGADIVLATGSGTTASGAATLKAAGRVMQAAAGTLAADTLASTSGAATSLAGTTTAAGSASLIGSGIALTGALTSNNGAVGLNAQGGTLSESGQLQAATGITAVSGQTTTLAGVTTAGTTLGVTSGADIMVAGGSVTTAGRAATLKAESAATLAGTFDAPLIVVTAPVINVSGGNIRVDGVVQPSGVLPAALPVLPSAPAAPTATVGAFFEAGSAFSQSGSTTVTTRGGSAQSTVRIDLTSGTGQVSLGNVEAQSTNLILNLGTGTATGGQLRVNNLSVLYPTLSQGGAAALSGMVGTQSGTGAAGVSLITTPSQNYRINSCAIGSVNCIVLRPQSVPVGNPLKELNLNFFREQDDDSELLVPNITEQGL